MAGLRACRSPCWNPPPTGKDKLAGATSTEGSGTPTPTPVVLRAPTPTSATAPAAAPSSDNKLFKQFMKAYLEAQVPGQIEVVLEPCEQPLKARFPDFYYGTHKWIAVNFVSNAKTILRPPGPKGQTEFHL